MRIQLIPNKIAPTRIEGFCNIPSWQGEQSVISFIKMDHGWMMGASMGLPSNIDQALEVKRCFDAAFDALEKERSR